MHIIDKKLLHRRNDSWIHPESKKISRNSQWIFRQKGFHHPEKIDEPPELSFPHCCCCSTMRPFGNCNGINGNIQCHWKIRKQCPDEFSCRGNLGCHDNNCNWSYSCNTMCNSWNGFLWISRMIFNKKKWNMKRKNKNYSEKS